MRRQAPRPTPAAHPEPPLKYPANPAIGAGEHSTTRPTPASATPHPLRGRHQALPFSTPLDLGRTAVLTLLLHRCDFGLGRELQDERLQSGQGSRSRGFGVAPNTGLGWDSGRGLEDHWGVVGVIVDGPPDIRSYYGESLVVAATQEELINCNPLELTEARRGLNCTGKISGATV
ncbi:hypothetical protein IMZ48_33320 [Candidatus Bathyarchaeota archaeon]|nr:hypothetical protein [Candidatus Bathyarchaeota archaeon]